MEYSEQKYQSLIEELFEKHPTVQKDGFSTGAYKPGLQGMCSLDETLGHPWQAYRTIHVAGTNGKGSVSSMVCASLASDGSRVGIYTSPHLLDFRERIRLVCGDKTWMIAKEEVFEFLDTYSEAIEGLSFFEITTGMAFWWFAKQEADWAVIEVGLGGRLDSTNIITPELSIVTSIGLDHCAMLGDTRALIAAEKAGIFKPGVPAVVWGRDEETEPVFGSIASTQGTQLHFASDQDSNMDEESLLSRMDLQGPCQRLNLHTVLVALRVLGIEPNPDAIARTSEITAFRGRWERLLDKPEVICDIGHNPPALKINFARLESLGRPLIIVYGIMADKDLDSIAPLMPTDARYILAAPDSSRSLPVGKLSERLHSLRPELEIDSCPSVAEAVSKALDMTKGAPETLVYIGGSTFVVSEAAAYLASIT